MVFFGNIYEKVYRYNIKFIAGGMKLLYLATQINNIGGLSRIVIDKINWLVDRGYEVVLCDIEPIEIIPAYEVDKRVKLIKGNISTTPGNLFVRAKGVFLSIRKLYNIIKAESPDIIVNVHCPLISWVLPFMHRRIPKVVEIHQSMEGLEVFNKQYLNRFAGWIHLRLTRFCYSLYDKFVVLTTDDQKAWNLPNCITIHNFTNLQPNEVAKDYKKKKQILLLTRLAPQKRIDLMIEIWSLLNKRFPDWTVLVLGEGQERAKLEKMVNEYLLNTCLFMPGETHDRKKIEATLQESSVLCLTSEYEGSALALLEAMHYKIPVMSYNILGISDSITDCFNGFVVEPFGDINKYAEKLSGLLESEDLRETMGNNAAKILQQFSKMKVMPLWDNLFQELKKV
mgnify:CR=1 FL=1